MATRDLFFSAVALSGLAACGGAPSEAQTPHTTTAAVAEVSITPASGDASRPDEAAEGGATAPEPDDSTREFGMIGLLNAGGDASAPTAPWGSSDDEIGGALGGLVGSDAGDAFGSGGLGLAGRGLGGGGTGEGIGLGTVGILGHGSGTGTGAGYGSGGGRIGGAPQKVARVRTEAMTTSPGGLPPEVVRRIVRQGIGKITACYDAGLATNPALAGRVSIELVISKTGAVSSTRVGSSTLPDTKVATCVADVIAKLSFPAPEGGSIVKVSYPFVFAPDASTSAGPAAPAAPRTPALHGKPLGEATASDLESALSDAGWTILSRTRRNGAGGASSIVDLVAEKNGVKAALTFQPSKHADAAISVDESSRIAAAGAARTSGDFFLGIVVTSDPKAADALLGALLGV
ncbi:MAG TPA: AgmX/PglI C-terminal domain-containing protein [Polyangiaceae bacterium]|nr:AgmX/PglI C-terminal domain-containing protein [Polyangiaceae bacterium]